MTETLNKILVVDDEPDVQTVLSLMLNGEGYETERAGSGLDALEAYRHSPSDVVVMDLHMPEMSGVEVIRQLKQIDALVAVVVLTGFGDLQDAVELFQKHGVYNYLTKPLESPEVLIAAVQGALEKRCLGLENHRLITELKKANEDLESQVASRTGALMASNRQLSMELRRRRRIEKTLEKERSDLERRVMQRTQKLSEINRRLNLEITERRRSEIALRQSELSAHMQSLELELFYRSAPVGLCLLDKDMKFIKANHTMTTITGLSLEDHLGQSLHSVSPRLAKALAPVSHRLMETGKPILSHVVSLPDGLDKSIFRHWLVSSYSLRIEGEGGVATSHIFQDISEQRNAQEFIRQSKTMLQAVFDGISDPLLMVDRQLTVRMLNRAAKSYYDIEAYGDIIGKGCDGIFPDSDMCASCRIPRLVAEGRPAIFERPGYMDPDKIEKVAIYPLSQSASGLDGAIIQVSDITETKSLERQLFHNEKLASLGMLVSGVAHEVNNPNGFITFNLPILRNYLEAMVAAVTIEETDTQAAKWFGMSFDAFCKEVFKLIDNLEHGSQRISKIIASMKSLARPQVLRQTMQKCELARLLEQVETLCRQEFRQRGQHLTLTSPPDLPTIFIDADALEQVLINLLMNAAQATDKADPWVRLTVERIVDGRLAFTVQDNGIGMDSDVLKRIFDPFYTTKPSGVGTGLGLAVCHNLMEGMGGTIHVESTPGKGSTFRFSVPVRYEDNPMDDDPEPSASSPEPFKALRSA